MDGGSRKRGKKKFPFEMRIRGKRGGPREERVKRKLLERLWVKTHRERDEEERGVKGGGACKTVNQNLYQPKRRVLPDSKKERKSEGSAVGSQWVLKGHERVEGVAQREKEKAEKVEGWLGQGKGLRVQTPERNDSREGKKAL